MCRFAWRALVAFSLLLVAQPSLAADYVELGSNIIPLSGEGIPVRVVFVNGQYGVIAENTFVCIATVARSPVVTPPQPQVIFNDCSNGWLFSTAEWQGRVSLLRSGSGREEWVSNDSVFAWWHRTIMRHAEKH